MKTTPRVIAFLAALCWPLGLFAQNAAQNVPADKTPRVLWVIFFVVVGVVLAFDLFVFNRSARRMGMREALRWVAVWVSLALLFNVAVWFWRGPKHGADFLTGYIVELTLSVDNLFV